MDSRPRIVDPILSATDYAVRADVEAAARRGLSRSDIVRQFSSRASRAAIYMWVGREIERMQAISLSDIEDPPPRKHVVVTVPTTATIPYLERLQANLQRLDMMLELAIRDGEIRNTRLALEVTKEIGVQLSRAARINAEIQDVEAQRRFLRSLADVIHMEEPEVRDRIVRKMREIGASGDVL